MNKKCFIIFILCSLLLLVAAPAWGADSFVLEQAQINQPEITVYLTTDSNPNLKTQDVAAFLGSEKLAVEKVSWLAEEQEGITYMLLADVSTSISNAQLRAIKESAVSLINRLNPNDRVILISFGLSLDVLLAGSEDRQTALAQVNTLQNNQEGTMFYEALYKAIEMANNPAASLPKRKVALVFSDSIDVNAGGVTTDEVSSELKRSCVSFYAFGLSTGSEQALNHFGQLARASGGKFARVNEQTLQQAVESAVQSLQNCVVLNLRASNNIVSGSSESLQVSFTANGAPVSLEREVTPLRHMADTTAPVIESVAKQSDRMLTIQFSEDVTGADNIKNYSLTGKSNAAILLQEAVYSTAEHTATITTDSDLLSDTIQIRCLGITDNSMEQNPLSQVFTYDLKGKSPFAAALEFFFLHYWWVVLILALIVMAVIIYLVIKKRKGVVVIDGKIGFGDHVEQQHRFALPDSAKLKLIVTEVSGKTSEVTLDVMKSIFVGRAEICELSFADNKLSKQHFVLEEENGEFYISDLGSTNGTFINGVRVQSRRKLNDNDVITAGQERLVYKKSEVT
jgi:hypothetical protein